MMRFLEGLVPKVRGTAVGETLSGGQYWFLSVHGSHSVAPATPSTGGPMNLPAAQSLQLLCPTCGW